MLLRSQRPYYSKPLRRCLVPEPPDSPDYRSKLQTAPTLIEYFFHLFTYENYQERQG